MKIGTQKESYQYDYGGNKYRFNELEAKGKGSSPVKEVYVESLEVKFEHVFQQISNDLYEGVEDGTSLSIAEVEKSLLKNLLGKFNRSQTAKITGWSVRTIRNKINKYGLREIRQDQSFLH